MAFVSAICTQCGGNITVDSTKEAGICEFCGTAFITEKAISNYNIFILGGDINNYLEIAANAIEAGNAQEAYDYANKALEIKPDTHQAWFLKMKSIALLSKTNHTKADEMVLCGSKAIEYAPADMKDDISRKVYGTYLIQSLSWLTYATDLLRDVDQMKKAAALGYAAIKEVMKADQTLREFLWKVIIDAVTLKQSIPIEHIQNHSGAQILVLEIVKQFIAYCNADIDRMAVYGGELAEEAVAARKSILQQLKLGLNENEQQSAISDETIKRSGKSGCYIATAIYGSYNCPQVCILRRFRDETLKKSRYGRLFIHVYYMISPTLVKVFGKRKYFNSLVKPVLNKIVQSLQDKGVPNIPYCD